MCGIAALFASSATEARERSLEHAIRALRHRGPDGCDIATSDRARLAHTRLAIIDVDGGAQPMRGEEPRFALVCNGEIYNHAQIREQLSGSHRMCSRSDSEVVLHLYEELGAHCVSELDGMFAFFVTDGERFAAARDAFGIKPLYVGWSAGTRELWFASEFKALTARCDGFTALPPGSYLTQEGRVRRWFSPRWAREVGRSGLDDLGELRRRLTTAVVKRLMSDVPVGVFLSGGLDSSIVAAIAREHRADMQTFAVGVPGAPDLAAARVVARKLGTRHRERTYSVHDMARALERVIYHLESYDAALIRSSLPCYFLSELAAESVKVVLTGEGADELFGGYGYFAQITDERAFHGECARLLLDLHGMNLQRVDRMTMAHGLEGRVPFLDTDFVAWSMDLDARLKSWTRPGAEKRLLRDAFESYLPASIVARQKLEFSAGSGAEAPLAAHAEAQVTDHDLACAAKNYPLDTPRTKEELLYRRIFEELFPGPWARANVQRWAGNERAQGDAPELARSEYPLQMLMTQNETLRGGSLTDEC